MTSYNLVNGQRSTSNWDAITGILQGEWKYEGLIMTDWCVESTIDEEIRAGGHVKMPDSVPYSSVYFDFEKAIADGLLTRENLLYSAKKVLEFMGNFE